ncbi:hypothetical protein [Pseudomonas sp. NY15374]|uniref:hypothetical protein n=1 Tax=Pseudomonas sp. NY15374 TaxID=3400357 RepID=UPI003A86940F
MSKYDEDYESSDWEVAFSNAVQEYLNGAGCSGLSEDEVDPDLMAEAEAHALEVVGPNPDEEE